MVIISVQLFSSKNKVRTKQAEAGTVFSFFWSLSILLLLKKKQNMYLIQTFTTTLPKYLPLSMLINATGA